jgi:hypothetical protein
MSCSVCHIKEYPAASHAFLNDDEAGPRVLRPLLRVAGWTGIRVSQRRLGQDRKVLRHPPTLTQTAPTAGAGSCCSPKVSTPVRRSRIDATRPQNSDLLMDNRCSMTCQHLRQSPNLDPLPYTRTRTSSTRTISS